MSQRRYVLGIGVFFTCVILVVLFQKNVHKFPLIEQKYNTKFSKCTVNFKTVYSMDMTSWNRNESVCRYCQKFIQTKLRTPFGNAVIFVYKAAQDPWVSGVLINSGHFENEKVNMMIHLLKQDPELNLIDIGANIGVFTLSAAKMGRKVLAVEALDRNVQHVCASIAASKLQEKVILVHNAISNDNSIVKLGIDRNNMGGTYVDVDSGHIKKLKVGRAQGIYGSVQTIKMDDLLNVPGIDNFPKIVLKMDIEGFEAKAIEGASLFFKKIEIAGFIMEWDFHKGQHSAKTILSFMKKHNFIPHLLNKKRHPLDLTKSESWGMDVLWLPKNR